ncbi:MAG TPA: hypothetical protein VEW91_08110 [bacterium]|nr:hypothetical protein [bacterium]
MVVGPRVEEAPLPSVHVEIPEEGITIIPVPRVIEMFSVSERELEQIAAASGSFAFHSVFFGITFGASMAFIVSLLSAELPNRMYALVWALFVLTLATIYFGVQASRTYREAGKGVRTIKTESRRVPPE